METDCVVKYGQEIQVDTIDHSGSKLNQCRSGRVTYVHLCASRRRIFLSNTGFGFPNLTAGQNHADSDSKTPCPKPPGFDKHLEHLQDKLILLSVQACVSDLTVPIGLIRCRDTFLSPGLL